MRTFRHPWGKIEFFFSRYLSTEFSFFSFNTWKTEINFLSHLARVSQRFFSSLIFLNFYDCNFLQKFSSSFLLMCFTFISFFALFTKSKVYYPLQLYYYILTVTFISHITNFFPIKVDTKKSQRRLRMDKSRNTRGINRVSFYYHHNMNSFHSINK